ncbi:hypothetical protein C0585_05675 [Candidatus Woesearchaeota archaeon]|nr:MAG: hypothetical protein C0585_05675 [Candidatus Woesearchaeota archaeon]
MEKYYSFGDKGSYSEMASKKLFPDKEIILLPSFQEIYDKVIEDKNSVGILPFYNTTTGLVPSFKELFNAEFNDGTLELKDDLSTLVDIYYLDITFDLIHLKKYENEMNIEKIFSNPVAYKQCTNYILNNFPNIDISKDYLIKGKEFNFCNPKAVNELFNHINNNYASISPSHLSDEAKFDIIERNINDQKDNKTYFAAFLGKS